MSNQTNNERVPVVATFNIFGDTKMSDIENICADFNVNIENVKRVGGIINVTYTFELVGSPKDVSRACVLLQILSDM